MTEGRAEPTGPDLSLGIPEGELEEGELLLGHVGDEPVLLARSGGRVFAVGAECTHYGVSLAGGLVAGGTVRCPAHHAAFDLETGEAVRAPALRPLPCWEVEARDGRVFVTRPRPAAPPRASAARVHTEEPAPKAVVIVGAGAAGSAAAAELRRSGYAGRLTLIGAEEAAPYDRPNLSKDFLAGTAPEEWLPLWPDGFFAGHGVDFVPGTRVVRIDPAAREVRTLNGKSHRYDALVLATGADPVRLPIPTHDLPHVHYLRTVKDARAVAAAAGSARRAVVVGASFIGLETAASLRARGLEVDVVGTGRTPLEHVLGADGGRALRVLHERHGVAFHLDDTVTAITPREVSLASGRRLPAELVVVGIGVRPGVGLASWAGVALDRGAVAVDEHLRTSLPGVYAAGDLVRWPDPRTGERIRSEHWVVAQRQGRTAARNLLGAREPFTDVPFFWSTQFEATLRYVGHAERWDRVEVRGSLEALDCTLAFRARGADGAERTLAVATLGRERESLEAELALERLDWMALDRLAGREAPAAG
jgi:apoptosis-inducing factor 3